jgi:hypothetical protein
MSVNQPEELNPKFEQDQFERELTLALRAVDPPEGFAQRTMARAHAVAPFRAKVLWMPLRVRSWAGGAIAAALLAGVFFAEETHQRHQREQAALAQQQFELAMRITDRTLEHTRQQLWNAGIRIGN